MRAHGLGRRPQFDERSRAFGIRALLPDRAPRSYTWACGVALDQGTEGACVGFSWAHELAARPAVVAGVTDALGRDIYRQAQRIDPWPGEDYEGTSVLAGVKVLGRLGYVSEYRWAFGVEDLAVAVGYAGPAVIGVDWHAGMGSPDSEGFIRPTGGVVGGHAILVRGYNVGARRFLLRNSWGADWGRGGDCFVSYDDMAVLLLAGGEACIPVRRHRR